MGKLERQLHEDRALRDAARRLLDTDLGLLKSDVQGRSLRDRTTDRLRETSATAADQAVGFARMHPYMIFGGIAALLAFLFRDSILDAIIGFFEDEPEDYDGEDLDGAEYAEKHYADEAEPEAPPRRTY